MHAPQPFSHQCTGLRQGDHVFHFQYFYATSEALKLYAAICLEYHLWVRNELGGEGIWLILTPCEKWHRLGKLLVVIAGYVKEVTAQPPEFMLSYSLGYCSWRIYFNKPGEIETSHRCLVTLKFEIYTHPMHLIQYVFKYSNLPLIKLPLVLYWWKSSKGRGVCWPCPFNIFSKHYLYLRRR